MAGMNGVTNGVNGHTNDHHILALATSAQDFLKHTYDFIVVGGGTAGLCVAARLSENSDVTVGVLEAGKNKLGDPVIDTPGLFMLTFSNPEYDWAFKTEPQKQNNNTVHHVPRGKVLGGSSGINYMMYVRGSDQDYDDWAAIVGDQGWSSQSMKQYMRKHQTLEPIDESIKDRSTMPFVGDNHGTSGPVHTSFNPFTVPLEDDFIKACDEATGCDKKPTDPWSGDHIGFYNTLGMVARTGPNKGKRSYAARTYFEANANRPNLHVLCEAMVSSVVLEGDKAIGVNFAYQGSNHTVKVNREVIVSCGAVQSPQVLELSGIGDPEVLKKAGVECKVENRAIGNNFQDHPLSVASWEVNVQTGDAMFIPQVMEAVQQQYMETQSGPLSCVSSMQGFFPYKLFATKTEQNEIIESIEQTIPKLTPFQKKQYECTLAHLKDDKSANIQYLLVNTTMDMVNGISDQSKLIRGPKSPDAPHQTLGILCSAYPLSRGSVHIKSSDPAEHPSLDPAFLEHPADTAVIAAGMRIMDKIERSKHLSDKIIKRTLPSPDVDLADFKQGKAWVHDMVVSEYHPCGSCAMGDALDSRLRVNGVRGLRVVDASVFPNHVSGNIVSSVYMVAEKAADMIKEDWDYAALAKAA